MRRRFRALTMVAVIVSALAAGIWFLPKARLWIAVDNCLDAGGRWDYLANRCDR